MNKLKKYDYLLHFFFYILFCTTLLSVLNLLFSLKNEINDSILILLMALYSIRLGIKTGTSCTEKAYKEGLKKGALLIAFLYLLSCFTLHFALPLKKIIYYAILLICIILGSIVGINKKKK